MEKKKQGFPVVVIAYAALLVALQIVLGNLLQIPLLGKQYNLGFLPIVAAGALLGVPGGMIVGGLGDLLGANIFPQGAYFPGFTLTNVLVGLCCGLLLYRRKPSLWRIPLAVFISMMLNWWLNSLWLSMLYSSKTYWGWVVFRGINYTVEVPLNIVLTYLLLGLLAKYRNQLPPLMRLNKE